MKSGLANFGRRVPVGIAALVPRLEKATELRERLFLFLKDFLSFEGVLGSPCIN